MSRADLDKDPHDVAAMFDGVARRYDLTNTVLTAGQDRRWRALTRTALDPQPGEAILDIGCGEGALTQAIAERGATVVGIDNSESMVIAAKARGLDARLMDAAQLRFSEAFDAAFSNAALHWMLDKERVAGAIFKSLRLGGRFAGEMGGEGNLARLREALISRA